jgi:hypothetical protein
MRSDCENCEYNINFHSYSVLSYDRGARFRHKISCKIYDLIYILFPLQNALDFEATDERLNL